MINTWGEDPKPLPVTVCINLTSDVGWTKVSAKALPVGEGSTIEVGPDDIPASKREEEVDKDDENDASSYKETPRCPDCQIGFIRVGNRSAVKRFADHLGIRHIYKCHECELDFASIPHLEFHIKYTHDTPCGVCSSYCGSECLEKLGKIMTSSLLIKAAMMSPYWNYAVYYTYQHGAHPEFLKTHRGINWKLR